MSYEFAGLSERDLLKVQRALGMGALAKVKENPYILSRLFPLKIVDGVAAKLGFSPIGNVGRGVAVAEYELDKALNDGHCYVHQHTLVSKARIDCKLREDFGPEELMLHGTIVVEGKHAMLRTIYDAEVLVADRVRELLQQPTLTEFQSIVFNGYELEVDEDQQRAVVQMICAPISVVTGPPGSGKTTIVKLALEWLDKQGVSYALCAPTGKAARRFSESTGRMATTIHRLLRWLPTGFEYNENSVLPYDVIFVDEVSMVDIRLAADLLSAIDPARTRIVFIGDANQLPPVGPGALLNDLIKSAAVHVVHLKTLHRAARGSWIYRNAQKILTGKGVELDADVPDFDWYEMRTDSSHQICETAEQVILSLLEAGLTWDDFQLIVPMKIKTGGAIELNNYLRKELLVKTGLRAAIGFSEDGFAVCTGDRVIQTRNNYDLNVFNGETGQVALVESPSSIRVKFEGVDGQPRFVSYKGVALRDLAPSYALTVHRVQGSEYPTVVFVCHSVHGRMLNRRLFYTAVTRARKKVILIGDAKGVEQAIASMQDMQRKTQLVERIKGQL